MAQYSHFRRTGTNLKTARVSPQVAWYGIATIIMANLSILSISKIVVSEYPTIILILTLSVPARSDFGYMTSSNTQFRVHVRACGLYLNATKSA